MVDSAKVFTPLLFGLEIVVRAPHYHVNQILAEVRLPEVMVVVVVGLALFLVAAARRVCWRLVHAKGPEEEGNVLEVTVRSKPVAEGKARGELVFVVSEGSKSKCKIGCSALGADSWAAACMKQPEVGSMQCD
jgi:hypothetical protein